VAATVVAAAVATAAATDPVPPNHQAS
jgi:hypothetical protein